MKQTLSLKNRLFFLIGGCTAIVFIIVIAFVANRTSSMATQYANNETEQVATTLASKVKANLEEGLEVTRTLANELKGYKMFDPKDRRKIYNQLMKQLLIENPNILSVWNVWETNAIDGMDEQFKNMQGSNEIGRYICGFSRDGNTVINNQVPEEDLSKGDYFQIPKKSGIETIIEPYYYKYTPNGKNYFEISISVPFKDPSGKFLGVAGIDISIENLQSFVDSSGYIAAIFSNQGTIVGHFDKTRIGKNLKETEKDAVGDKVNDLWESVNKGKPFNLVSYMEKINGNAIINTVPFSIGLSQTPWAFAIAVPEKIATVQSRQITYFIVIFGLVGMAILFIVLYIVTGSIVRPITKGVALAERIAQGDLTSTFEIHRDDEIGKLAHALNEMVNKIHSMVNNISQGARNITSASKEIAASSQHLAEGANEQASSVEEVSSAIEQMASNIQQNTENAVKTNNMATEAAHKIIETNKSTDVTIKSMNSIAEKILIINDIAFQTNILALNAAVEAARAGEHGRGFAVVASEVRKLAEHSKIAAEEIDRLSNEGVKVADNSGKQLGALVPEIQKTALLIQEIASASKEQSSGSDQINQAIQQLNTVTQKTAATAEELATSAEEMSAQSQSLLEMVSFFKTKK